MAQNITLMGANYPDVPAVDLPKTGGGTARFVDLNEVNYAGSPSVGGNANTTNAILYGTVDGTSTSTAFTATVSGLTALTHGTCVMLKNGVVTSASGFTINVNGLGAKPVYNNMAAATADTTIFNINYTMLFVYDTDRVEGGCWVCYRGYNSDNNTIGYQLRTNSTVKPTITRTRYYRLLFTSADDTKWVPANTGYDNSATSKKTVNQNAIDPFGTIVYMTGTTNVNANVNVGATVTCEQYTLNLGYSFNTTGQALELTNPAPVYVKCAPQSNGSAVIDSTTPYVQSLPSTEDGKIYIYLGMAYNATNIELVPVHPVYYYKDSAIRLWTNAASGGGGGTDPATASPLMDGTAAVGSSTKYAREDHVHPTDTGRAAASHTHGNITNDGKLQTSDITIANGDKLVVTDSSDSNKVARASIAFDGSTTTRFLSKRGTWEFAGGVTISVWNGAIDITGTVESSIITGGDLGISLISDASGEENLGSLGIPLALFSNNQFITNLASDGSNLWTDDFSTYIMDMGFDTSDVNLYYIAWSDLP